MDTQSMRGKAGQIALLLAGFGLAACGPDGPQKIAVEDDGSGEYSMDEATGEQSMVIATPDGEATMRSGPDVTPDLPDGWSIYPGAKIDNATNIGGVEGSGTLVTMSVDAPIEDVIAFYLAQAEATGHDNQMDLTTSQGRSIAGETSDGGSYSVGAQITPDGEPITVQLMVGRGS